MSDVVIAAAQARMTVAVVKAAIALVAVLNSVTDIISVAELRVAVAVLITDEILWAVVTVAEARIADAPIKVYMEILDIFHTLWKE